MFSHARGGGPDEERCQSVNPEIDHPLALFLSGMSDAYDDRIFALSTVVSSVLVYNLPETVKETVRQCRLTSC